jgi:hypothetical protein
VSDAEVSEFGYPQVTQDSTADGDQAWIEARQELVSEAARVFGVSPPMALASGHLSALCLVLNGLTILCDWVASNEEFFPCAVYTAGNLYAAEAWSLAQNAVESGCGMPPSLVPADG